LGDQGLIFYHDLPEEVKQAINSAIFVKGNKSDS